MWSLWTGFFIEVGMFTLGSLSIGAHLAKKSLFIVKGISNQLGQQSLSQTTAWSFLEDVGIFDS